jgi:hypothetical protein
MRRACPGLARVHRQEQKVYRISRCSAASTYPVLGAMELSAAVRYTTSRAAHAGPGCTRLAGGYQGSFGFAAFCGLLYQQRVDVLVDQLQIFLAQGLKLDPHPAGFAAFPRIITDAVHHKSLCGNQAIPIG